MSERGSEEWFARSHRLAPQEKRPAIIDALADGLDGSAPRLAWRNDLGGQTWLLGDRCLKWSPRSAGIDLGREAERMRWLAARHPAPRVLETGVDGAGQWILSVAIPAESAVADRWREDPRRAVRAIAEGLRRLHALPVAGVPTGWSSWLTRAPEALGSRPPLERPVVVHGDACSPNTLIDADGRFAAHVDLGDLAVGDRWADLAVATMAIGWNYGDGWDDAFYAAYGIRPDLRRIRYYRALWHAES